MTSALEGGAGAATAGCFFYINLMSTAIGLTRFPHLLGSG